MGVRDLQLHHLTDRPAARERRREDVGVRHRRAQHARERIRLVLGAVDQRVAGEPRHHGVSEEASLAAVRRDDHREAAHLVMRADLLRDRVVDPPAHRRCVTLCPLVHHRHRHTAIHLPALMRIRMRVERDADRVRPDLEGEEGEGTRPVLRPVAVAVAIDVDVVRHALHRRRVGSAVDIVAVVERADQLFRRAAESCLEVLLVAPRRKPRVVAERVLGHRTLRPHRAARLDDADRRQGDARREEQRRPAERGEAEDRHVLEGVAPEDASLRCHPRQVADNGDLVREL